eukprot:sb/3478468/
MLCIVRIAAPQQQQPNTLLSRHNRGRSGLVVPVRRVYDPLGPNDHDDHDTTSESYRFIYREFPSFPWLGRELDSLERLRRYALHSPNRSTTKTTTQYSTL